MPQRPGTACRKPGCPGIVHNGVCTRCGPLKRQRNADHDAQRGTAADRGYDRRWRNLRLVFLADHPLCAKCEERGETRMATDVHHVTPKRDGGTDDEANLMALCHECHSAITAAGG